jgi:hypothetical protein
MKNHWLDQKAKRLDNQRAEQVRRGVVEKRLASLRTAHPLKKNGKKPCGCQSINAKFLEEAKNLEAAWKKSGLLKDLPKNWMGWNKSGVLLEGQRLNNEKLFRITVRTAKTEHLHGFDTKEELFSHLHMLSKDKKTLFLKTRMDYNKKPMEGYTNVFLDQLELYTWEEYIMWRARGNK